MPLTLPPPSALTDQPPRPTRSEAGPRAAAGTASDAPSDARGDILWLGAHKTGTTSLQQQLARSRQALSREGLFYIDMLALRARYTRPVLDQPPAPMGDPLPPLPRAPSHSLSRYLVFDENIPGLVQDALHPTGLYPDAGERALRLCDTLQLERPRLVLGIRSFASYLPSLYCETLKSMPFRPFSQFWSGRLGMLSWCDLVERLLAAFPGAPLWLYRAEDLRGCENALLAWVSGLDPDALPRPRPALRAGFSQAAIEALHARAPGQGLGPLDLHRITRQFPRRTAGDAFSPWGTRQKRELALLYQTDLDALQELAAREPRLRIWAGPPRTATGGDQS